MLTNHRTILTICLLAFAVLALLAEPASAQVQPPEAAALLDAGAVTQPSAVPTLPSPPAEYDETMEQVLGVRDAVKGGKWILAFGLCAMVLGSLGRWAMSQKYDFWGTRAGGYSIAAIMFFSSLGTGIATLKTFNIEMFAAALAIALAAMGAHTPAKDTKKKLARV